LIQTITTISHYYWFSQSVWNYWIPSDSKYW